MTNIATWWKLMPSHAGPCDTRWRGTCDDDGRAKLEVVSVGKFTGIKVTLFLCENCERIWRVVWEGQGGAVYSRRVGAGSPTPTKQDKKEDFNVA